jgi:ATP-binding cassette subfamily F protein 3
MIEPVNLLVLDEPTNHLDLASCDLLEDALAAYPGTVLLVSHDRHLIRNVATGLVAVREGRARYHDGVDEAVLSPHHTTPATAGTAATTATTATAASTAVAAPAAPARPAAPAPRGDGRAAARKDAAEARARRHAATKELKAKVSRLERDLGRAEAEVAELQRRLADPATYDDPETVRELARRHDAAKDAAAALMDEWLTASQALEDAERRLG